jgi:hypothetical protein
LDGIILIQGYTYNIYKLLYSIRGVGGPALQFQMILVAYGAKSAVVKMGVWMTLH